jgi:hypothetical protein
LREKAWFDSSPRSRASFASPHPGYPKSSEFEQPQLDPSQGAIDTFCVLTLDPKEVVSLHLLTSFWILTSTMWMHVKCPQS